MRNWINILEGIENLRPTGVFEVDGCEIVYNVIGENVEITAIETPSALRSQGKARLAITKFLEEVDAHGYSVSLMAQRMGKGGLTNKQLEKFYQTFGFETQPKKSKFESSRMVRPAKKLDEGVMPDDIDEDDVVRLTGIISSILGQELDGVDSVARAIAEQVAASKHYGQPLNRRLLDFQVSELSHYVDIETTEELHHRVLDAVCDHYGV